jgi:hypothetical protein
MHRLDARRMGTLLGLVFGLTGAALGLWFGTQARTASPDTLSVMWPLAGVFVVASLTLPLVFAAAVRRASRA